MTKACKRPIIGATERATFVIGSRPVPALLLQQTRALPLPLSLALVLAMVLAFTLAVPPSFAQQTAPHTVVLRAAHLLEVGTEG